MSTLEKTLRRRANESDTVTLQSSQLRILLDRLEEKDDDDEPQSLVGVPTNLGDDWTD